MRRHLPARFSPVCGGCGTPLRAHLPHSGSAPRVRGMPEPRRWFPGQYRFSPTCAGKAVEMAADYIDATVQLRVYGECGAASISLIGSAGSAPRVRGMHSERTEEYVSERFSPVCAGNATDCASDEPMMPVQPRVCGECEGRPAPAATPCGSAPRVRGMRCALRRSELATRFSPACAGNAGRSVIRPKRNTGSAPPVRGMPAGAAPSMCPLRFSPACAGNAYLTLWCTSCGAVQPRVCGECVFDTVVYLLWCGSAPRVRGMLLRHHLRTRQSRFSPACAGNAATRRWTC